MRCPFLRRAIPSVMLLRQAHVQVQRLRGALTFQKLFAANVMKNKCPLVCDNGIQAVG